MCFNMVTFCRKKNKSLTDRGNAFRVKSSGLVFAVLMTISKIYPTEVKDMFHTFTASLCTALRSFKVKPLSDD